MEQILYKWIPSVGFPIAVAMYLLIRVEPRINALTDCVKELIAVVKADTVNTKNVENGISTLNITMIDLKNEIGKINK